MNGIERLIDSVRNKGWKFRFKLIDKEPESGWSDWIASPTKGYLEFEKFGPLKISDLEWIEIDPMKIIRTGKLISDKYVNQFDQAIELLSNQKIRHTSENSKIKITMG